LPKAAANSFSTAAFCWEVAVQRLPLDNLRDRDQPTLETLAMSQCKNIAARRPDFFDGSFFAIALLHQNRLAGDTCSWSSRN